MKQRFLYSLTILILMISVPQLCLAQDAVWPSKTTYKHQDVNGHKIFYREAGDPAKTTIILLHGYPSSSHTYRELIPLLSGRYHVIAPDNLGSGYSDKPNPETTEYNFDLLAEHIIGLIEALDIETYVIYMQDFGAPVGYRVMMHDPSKVKAIIAQNANAYLEGIPQAKQNFFNNAQLDKSPENIAKLFAFTSFDAVKHKQYLRDVKGKEQTMSPDSWTHDSHFLQTELERNIQVALFQDYKTNLDSYPTWQAFLRQNQLPTLLVWGKHDPVFMASGAKAYLNDLPKAELHLLDAGHFAAEEKPVEIAKHITLFLDKHFQ
ncbi:MAG: alpha/beta fold hydrolase [Alphaproteobacteria bacterium]